MPERRALDRVLGPGNWGPPHYEPGKYPNLKMSYFDRGGWLPKGITIGEYWDNAVKLNPDEVCFVDCVEGEEWVLTRKEADECIKKLALAFIDMGVKPGDKIGTAMVNSVRFALVIQAINYIGAVWLPLHAFLREMEWRYIVNHGDAKVMVCDEMHRGFSLAKLANKLKPEMPMLENIVVWGNPEPGQMRYQDILKKDWSTKYPGDYIHDVYLKENHFTADDICEIIYTSGTTGPPKGAMHTHDDNAHHGLVYIYHDDLGHEDSLMNFAIMSHQHGYGVVYQTFTMAALPCYFIGDWNRDNALKAIDKWRPTHLGVNPPVVADLASAPDIDKYDTSSVRAGVSAGARLPLPVSLDIKKKMKNPYYCTINAYGMSECNGECATPSGDYASAELSSKSVGLVHVGCQIKLVNPTREHVVPIGETGEIACRGGLVGVGYYKSPEKTHADWDDKGWMYSGDLGRMDERGNVYVVGRSKDTVNRGGNVVQPEYVESIIVQHPGVAKVGVVGIPHPRLVESTCAIIVPKEKGKVITLDEIKKFMAPLTARDNIPDRVEIWDNLIYTATGKVVKYQMRDIVNKHMEEDKAAGKDPYKDTYVWKGP